MLANVALSPAAALALVLPLFLPVAVAVVAGDAVAGEASRGRGGERRDLSYFLVARWVGRWPHTPPAHGARCPVRRLVQRGVAAVAVFLSTLTGRQLAAAPGAVALLIASSVFLTPDASAALSPYLPTRY